MRSSAHHLSRAQVHQGGGAQSSRATPHAAIGTGISSQNAQAMVAAQRVAQMNRMSLPVQNQIKRTGSPFSVNANGGVRSPAGAGGEQRGGNIEGGSGMVHAVSRAEDLVDLASEQNWRPTGRMRGSLVGRAYNSALNQLVIQPTQPTQATRPPLTPIASPPPGFPPNLRALLTTNTRTPLVPQAPNYPMTQSPTTTGGGSGILPDRSLG